MIIYFMEMSDRILILGADGFIGSNLAKRLEITGASVYAFDLFRDGFSRNIEEFSENLVMVPGDFLNRNDLRKALEGMDYVFHFISLTTPGSSMNNPLIDIETNIRGSVVLFEECVRAGVKRLIFASSGGGIYGNQGKERYSETDCTEPVSPYAISKLTIERFLEYYRVHFGLDSLILRYSNPYGPGQNIIGNQGLIPIFLNRIKRDESIEIFGDGENIRDYIYIHDLVSITEQMYRRPLQHSIYNVGSGQGKSINEIIEVLEKVTKKQVEKKYLPGRDVDVRSVILSTERTVLEIGDIEMTTLESGIMETWKWIEQKAS